MSRHTQAHQQLQDCTERKSRTAVDVKKKNWKVLDLFSGCGGFSYGFEQQGAFEVIGAIDNWQDALNTYSKNHPNARVLNMDLGNYDINQVSREIPENIDLIIGGPPCQGFSISGKRDPLDPRNQLYIAFIDLVDLYKPSMFILENVPNLMSMSKGNVGRTIIQDFEDIGYHVKYKILLASDYGVPQNRRRVFIVGTLNEKEFEFPEATHSNNKVTTKDAIHDLPEGSLGNGAKYVVGPLSNYQELMRKDSSGVYNHEVTDHKPKTVETISLVPDGGNYRDLPKDLQSIRKVNIAWTRFSSQKPSHTIDTGHRHHFHYKWNRVPTVRESARLQSFPDKFIFYGSKTSQYKQVGNAVPPILAQSLAGQVNEYLSQGDGDR